MDLLHFVVDFKSMYLYTKGIPIEGDVHMKRKVKFQNVKNIYGAMKILAHNYPQYHTRQKPSYRRVSLSSNLIFLHLYEGEDFFSSATMIYHRERKELEMVRKNGNHIRAYRAL